MQADDTDVNPKIIVDLAREELRKSSLAHLKRLRTLEQVERMQNALIREGPTRESSNPNVQIPRTREASKEVQPAYIDSIHGQVRDPHHGNDQPTDALEGRCMVWDCER